MKIDQTTVSVISGAASGMGKQVATRLAALGAKVALFDLQQSPLQAVAEEIGGIAVPCDVTDPQAVELAMHHVSEVLGPVRVGINCAGIAPAGRIVSKQGPLPLAEFSKVIAVNLIGSFNMMRLEAAQMISQPQLADTGERGIIINTASIAAYEGQIGQVAYSASKGGVVAMTLPAAREFAQFGVRVNCIAPGLIATPLLAGLPEAAQTSLAAAVPFPRRLGEPDEFAALAIHMIENSYLNGTVIRLDGALRLQPK